MFLHIKWNDCNDFRINVRTSYVFYNAQLNEIDGPLDNNNTINVITNEWRSWKKCARRDPHKVTRHSQVHINLQTMIMSNANSQDLSTAMAVISANIEGLTATKETRLSEMYKREHYHCLCLQETHRALHLTRLNVTEMTIKAEKLQALTRLYNSHKETT